MLLTEQHIERYKRLDNPPQALYNALVRQVQVNSKHRGRVFTVPEGGYMAFAIYYYFLKAARLQRQGMYDRSWLYRST